MTGPRRVLLVTGAMGEGHNAAARAVAERVRTLWPHAELAWTETLAGMGRLAGPTFRGVYAGCVRVFPWLYELYFVLLWRWRFFARATRAVHGIWGGPRLAATIAAFRPDLVVATFPEAVAALGWLRRRGRLDVPTVALVCDAAPHPLWAHPNVDQHLVLDERALALLHRAEPAARGAVCGLPVASAFAPRSGARAGGALRVLVSCGSLGFGPVEDAVRAVLAAGAVAVVLCGRNNALRERLERLKAPPGRLRALGWVDPVEMPRVTAQADVVVTNAGGAGALEALASGRPLLTFRPIAGHGRANAALLAAAGVAPVCHSASALTASLRELDLPAAERRVRCYREVHDFTAAVAGLAALTVRTEVRMRAQDAFFLRAETPAVDQRVGAVIVIDDPDGELAQWNEYLHDVIRTRTPELPMLRHRLLAGGRWRHPRWRIVERVEPTAHLRAGVPDVAHAGGWPAVLAGFFGALLPADRPPWQLQLVRDAAAGQTAILAGLHHALGDGLAVTDTLVRLLADRGPATSAPRPPTRRTPEPTTAWWERARQVGVLARGLVSLAAAGFAPRSSLDGPMTDRRRRYLTLALPAPAVRAAARRHRVGTTALLLAVLAEALHRLLTAREGTLPGQQLRAMVPMTTRFAAGASSRALGNRTAAVSVDLPVGPMSPAERVTTVARRLAELSRRGQPEAAAAVMAGLGKLPAPLHAAAVRLVYHRRFFNLLASVMPGPRRPTYARGMLVSAVYPVIPLAEGVGLAVGVLGWGTMMGVGVSADPELVGEVEDLPGWLREAFDDVRE